MSTLNKCSECGLKAGDRIRMTREGWAVEATIIEMTPALNWAYQRMRIRIDKDTALYRKGDVSGGFYCLCGVSAWEKELIRIQPELFGEVT